MDWNLVLENSLKGFIGINAVYFAVAALGLNVQFGYTGLLNFGQAGFMACGAYGLGMTSKYFGISMWWGIPLGILFSVALGLLMGIPTLRLRADYLAIVTIASAEIIRLIVRSVKFKTYFGGSDGINGFSDDFRKLGNSFGIEESAQYGFWPFRFTGRELWTLVVGWIVVALLGFLVYKLMKSPWGRVLKAIREDEDAVKSLGKNVFSYKMQSLILGGVIGTISGMRWGGQGVRFDHRSDDLLGLVHLHGQFPAPGRQGSHQHRESHHHELDPGRSVQLHADRAHLDSPDGVPTPRCVRESTGDGLRWALNASSVPPRSPPVRR